LVKSKINGFCDVYLSRYFGKGNIGEKFLGEWHSTTLRFGKFGEVRLGKGILYYLLISYIM